MRITCTKQNIIQTPDFIGLPNIQSLSFEGCTILQDLHPSVGGLKQLIELDLKDCKCLENLPHELNFFFFLRKELNLESLEILFLAIWLFKTQEVSRDWEQHDKLVGPLFGLDGH